MKIITKDTYCSAQTESLEKCLKEIGCKSVIAGWFLRLSERTLDVLFVIDDNGKIRFASPTHLHSERLISPESKHLPSSLIGADYFETLLRVKRTNKRIKQIPLWCAMQGERISNERQRPVFCTNSLV